MPPFILDPRDTATTGGVARRELPAALGRLRRVPRPQDLEPGDLLLFHAIAPQAGSWLIMRAQGRRFDGVHSIWHHAAVYLGGMRICEAAWPGGVRKSDLAGYLVVPHLLRVRRGSGHLRSQRKRIAVEALREVGKSYAAWMAFKQGLGMLTGLGIGAGSPSALRATTCALLYYYSYLWATGGTVTDARYIVPAALSETTRLAEVCVRWASVR